MNMVRKEQLPQPSDESAAVLSMIARAASDPSIDIDKMERLMQMQERAIARQGQTAYDEAMAALQPELPVIAERGDAQGRYTFAKWEDIQAAIKPVLQKHGFALTFRIDTRDGIAVAGILSHRSGHREETSITLPADPSGNKNAVQAVASAVQYGKRYTASALLNLTSHGEDDDAYRAAVVTVSDEQEIELREMADSVGADMPKFLAYMKVGSLSAIPAKDYTKALNALKAKAKK